MPINFVKVMNNVRKQVVCLIDMKCRKHLCCIVNFFYVWGVDFIGPLSSLLGFIYILLVVDYVLKWVETKATLTDDSNIVFK